MQEKLLLHGPNFVIVPKEPPTPEYIAAIEKACLKLPTGKAEELMGEVKAILKKKTNYKPNITKEEHWAIKELRRENTRMVLTTDKGSVHGGDGQGRLQHQIRRVITTANIPDPEYRSHK